MEFFNFKLEKLILPFALSCSLLLSMCSIDPNSAKRSKDGSSPSSGDSKTGLDSLAAFQQTVYPLVRKVTCANCHGSVQSPMFAADSVEDAHKVILDQQKVDLENPEKSRLVQRLVPDSHNCWTVCADDAKEMLAAITKWKDLMGKKPDDNAELGSLTGELAVADATEKKGDSSGTILLEAESGTIKAPMRVTNGATNSGGKFVDTPNNNQTFQANNNAAGTITFSVNVTAAGNYFLFGLVNAPTANDNSFFARIDAGTALVWAAPVNAAAFTWDLASDQAAGGTPIQFQLTAGAHTLEVRERTDGAKLDTVALTTDMNFQGSGAEKRMALRFSLADIVDDPDAFFEIDVSEFDAFSYKFKNPTIVSTKKIHVSGVRVLVNNKFNPQAATYTIVDQTVNAPGGILSAAALIVPMVNGAEGDQISIAFEKIEVAD